MVLPLGVNDCKSCVLTLDSSESINIISCTLSIYSLDNVHITITLTTVIDREDNASLIPGHDPVFTCCEGREFRNKSLLAYSHELCLAGAIELKACSLDFFCSCRASSDCNLHTFCACSLTLCRAYIEPCRNVSNLPCIHSGYGDGLASAVNSESEV